MTLNTHDWRVIAFHVFIAMLQAGLIALGAYHYGTYDPYIALSIQVLSEALRRFVA